MLFHVAMDEAWLREHWVDDCDCGGVIVKLGERLICRECEATKWECGNCGEQMSRPSVLLPDGEREWGRCIACAMVSAAHSYKLRGVPSTCRTDGE